MTSGSGRSVPVNAENADGRLISFDEGGFTGPNLLDEHQPYFVYASHDFSVEEAASLTVSLRERYRLQGTELKATRLKRRGDWMSIVSHICAATRGRAKVLAHNKRAALAGKFFEYFFEPVLSENSKLFYSVNFHRYMMNTIYKMMGDSDNTVDVIARQMQAFMRSFDPADAPDIFSGYGNQAVEMDRILRFCRGYSATIVQKALHLRAGADDAGKWTLDLTTSALFSLLFSGWGHTYPRLRLLCDDSKPLAAGVDFFNSWVGQDQSVKIIDGKAGHEIRGNLVAPVEFGSSATHPTIQIADLLAGITLDTIVGGARGHCDASKWLQQHQHSHSIDYQAYFTQRSSPSVAVGREILKELASRADSGADPLEGMQSFVRRAIVRTG